MTGAEGFGEQTRAVHAPPSPPSDQVPLGLPIYRTAAFRFRDSQEYADVLDGRRRGHVYSREGNPTTEAFAAAVAAMEGHGLGAAANGAAGKVTGEAFASGMAAITTVLMTLCRAGSRVVVPREIYGGTYAALTTLLDRFGVTADFVDGRDPASVGAALTPQTALVWAETLANPTLSVADLPAMAEIAHHAEVPLVVDSTFASPAVCRPLHHGADLVLHSATKYIGGHSDVMGGVVVGAPAVMERVRRTRSLLGGSLSPDDAFLLHRGLTTLPLRMTRHCASAQQLAERLAEQPEVSRVCYPGLPDSPDHALAGRLFEPGRYGAVVSIVVPGGRVAAAQVCDAARLAAVASSLGGAHTVLSPIATTTHRMLDDATLAAAGMDAGTIRISVGLEDPEDLVVDLIAALGVAAGAGMPGAAVGR